MKKTVLKTLITLLAAGMLCIPAFAADYSAMSNEELSALRGTMRTATDQDRDAFRREWQKRIQSMTPEEAQSYRGRPAGAAADGLGYRYNRSNTGGIGNCDGTGKGYGRRGGRRMN